MKFNTIRMGAVGAAIAATLGMSSAAFAAQTASASAEVEILDTLTLNVQSGSTLDFGQIAINGAGTATLSSNPATAISCTANLVCAGTPSPVGFDVTGTSNASVAISVPSSPTTITNTTDTIVLQNFTASAPSITLTGGLGAFTVGAELDIAGTESAGNYIGSFNVIVEYN